MPGKTTVAGKPATRFCGPAHATAKVGAKKFVFTGGVCQTSGIYFTVNIGTVVNNKLATAKPGPLPYFDISLTPASTGTHLTQGLTWIVGGKRYCADREQDHDQPGVQERLLLGQGRRRREDHRHVHLLVGEPSATGMLIFPARNL